jgi:hypothetical protein
MSTTNRPSDFGHSSKDALRDADLNAVTGGASPFVSFGDIKGESTDKDHKDWISLLAP